MDIFKDNLSVSVLYGHGESLSSVTLDQKHITRKNKRNTISDTSIIRKNYSRTNQPKEKGKIGYYN